MVTSSEITVSSGTISVDPEEIYEIYKSISCYALIPKIHDIFGHYCTEVDSRMTTFQQNFYLDDYDSASGNIPDSMAQELMQHIKLPLDMTPEELMYILDRANLVYWRTNYLQNKPLREVW